MMLFRKQCDVLWLHACSKVVRISTLGCSAVGPEFFETFARLEHKARDARGTAHEFGAAEQIDVDRCAQSRCVRARSRWRRGAYRQSDRRPLRGPSRSLHSIPNREPADRSRTLRSMHSR